MTFPANPTPADLASHLADRFDEDQLPYAFGGALCLGAWGVPRTTSDVDVAVFVSEADLGRALDSVERAGALVDRGEAARTVARTGMFFARLAGTRVDVFIAHHPLHGDMERRRTLLTTPDGKRRWFLSVEDLVVTKLIYGRPKDISDLDRLFAVQSGKLDVGYVRGWLERIVPASDARHGALESLVQRFGA
jgi:hypothetical protein